jgi:hypothetical protein
MNQNTLRHLGTVLLVVLVLSLASCGKSGSMVSGTVTYKGQPLPGGIIVFQSADGGRHPGSIGVDGSYTALVPPGEMKVGVDTTSLKNPTASGGPPAGAPSGAPSGLPGGGPEIAKKQAEMEKKMEKEHGSGIPADLRSGVKYVQIPDKYRDPNTSGLTADVKKGPNKGVDFDLR